MSRPPRKHSTATSAAGDGFGERSRRACQFRDELADGAPGRSSCCVLSAPLACAEGCGKASLFRMMRAQMARYARAVAGGPAYQSFRVA